MTPAPRFSLSNSCRPQQRSPRAQHWLEAEAGAGYDEQEERADAPRKVVEDIEERPDDNRQKWRVGLARALPCFAVSGTSLGGPDELSGTTTPGCKGAFVSSLCIVEASEGSLLPRCKLCRPPSFPSSLSSSCLSLRPFPSPVALAISKILLSASE